jgi:N-acyl-D-amino-acid deacylase
MDAPVSVDEASSAAERRSGIPNRQKLNLSWPVEISLPVHLHSETAMSCLARRFTLTAMVATFMLGLLLFGKSLHAQTREINSTGDDVPDLSKFDEMMRSFMKENRIPGASLAVTHKGKLVYNRGFGFADRDTEELVRPQSLFRIASISKPITAVAIMKLVEERKVKLDQPVFELLEIEPFIAKDTEADPRLKDITILNCLQHTGGWDRGKSDDPMFEPVKIAKALGIESPPGPRDVIRYMQGQPLDFTPGERFAYANIDYCILGRVIEKLTGRPYDEHMQETVFKPLGMRSLRLGHTLPEERAPGEVTYYAGRKREPSVFAKLKGREIPLQYGAFHLEAMDAHGAWLSTAADLARFAAAFDDPTKCSILKPETIATMWARPIGAPGCDAEGKPAEKFYACGWVVRPAGAGGGSAVHSGALEGTATLLIHRNDGINMAVLFSKRYTLDGKEISVPVMPLLHEAADSISAWPEKTVRETVE